MNRELNEALRMWAAQASAEIFAGRGLKFGDYLAHVPRDGVVRQIGRVDGFTIEVRSVGLGPVHAMRPGDTMRTEAVALVRVAAKRNGGMLWSQACQHLGERVIMSEWRPADPELVRGVLRQINAPAERRAMPHIDPALSPDKGR